MASNPDDAKTDGTEGVREQRPFIEEDRRQSPRVDLLREFQGHLIALDEAVTVQQLGPGGLVLAAAVPLSPAQVHDLRLTLDEAVISVRAKVVHTRTVVAGDDVSYVSGMAFVDPPRDTLAVIEHFLGLDVFADGR